MIPKKIHYCWFGGKPIPEEYKKNIESWKKYNPDYEIIRWDESNYDYKKNRFIEEAYSEKKWAFVTDYARLDIIYMHGGIYLDTDVEVLKSFDDLLVNEAFMGLETGNYVNTGVGFGAVKGQKGIKLNKEYYENKSIYDAKGKLNLINCPIVTTDILKEHGAKIDGNIESVLGITIYPIEYFCPMDYLTGIVSVTKNSYSIHKYSMSWASKWDKKKIMFEGKVSKFIGKKLASFVSKILFFPFKFFNRLQNDGFRKTINYYLKR